MSRNAKLNDLQLILLATAAQREDGSILPLADSISDQEERIRKAIPALLRRRFVEEVPSRDRTRTWREEDEQPIGLTITDAGRAIIAAGEDAPAPVAAESNSPIATAEPTSTNRTGTKADLVLGLLGRPEGATLAELVEATGWLPHTTRAALTGLRKKGHLIEKTRRDETTRYRIATAS